MYDADGEHVYPEDVLEQEELGQYYNSIGYKWWEVVK